jgi:hypothetical protein
MMPESVMYGRAGELARTLQAPLGWAYTAVLTLCAGIGVRMAPTSGEAVRPTLYTALVGAAGDGKSRTINRARKTLELAIPRASQHFKMTTPGSDRGLYRMFEVADEDGGSVPPLPGDAKSWVLVQDEIRDMLAKIKIKGSSLAPTLCSLYYQDTAGSADKSGDHTITVRLSILGALKAADDEEFTDSFGSATCAGLYDRFIFCPGPRDWQWDDQWQVPLPECLGVSEEDDLPAPEHLAHPVEVPAATYGTVDEWRKSAGEGHRRGRIGEIALRVAVITAAVNGDREVGTECLAAALRFAEWQERVRAYYAPSEAQNIDAVVSHTIMEALEAWDKEHPNRFARFRDLARKHNWHRKYGATTLTRNRKALVHEGLLEEEEDDKGRRLRCAGIRINRA